MLILFGSVINDLGDEISVTVIATGFESISALNTMSQHIEQSVQKQPSSQPLNSNN